MNNQSAAQILAALRQMPEEGRLSFVAGIAGDISRNDTMLFVEALGKEETAEAALVVLTHGEIIPLLAFVGTGSSVRCTNAREREARILRRLYRFLREGEGAVSEAALTFLAYWRDYIGFFQPNLVARELIKISAKDLNLDEMVASLEPYVYHEPLLIEVAA